MLRIKFSLRTFVLACLTISAAMLAYLSSVPRTWGLHIVAQWKGKGYPGLGYYAQAHHGGLIDSDFMSDIGSLRRLGPVGVRLLCDSLNSEDRCQKICVLIGVQALGPDAQEALPKLIPMLNEGDQLVLTEVIGCLAEIGPAARPALPRVLELKKSFEAKTERETYPVLYALWCAISHITESCPSLMYFHFENPPKTELLPRRVKLTLPLAINHGSGVGLPLAILFGALCIWSFLSDRRYFRQLQAAKQAASTAAKSATLT